MGLRNIILASIFVVFAPVLFFWSVGGEKASRNLAGYSASLSPSSEDLSFNELSEILQKNQFSKIEDLLKYLKQNKPGYVSHYALGYESLSLQGSSKEFPRAIVYGKTANFIIAFNGHPDQKNYQMLEMVEFNHVKNEFEFREIEFRETGNLEKPYEISKIDGPDSKCLNCHNQSRPIWEPYPVWPGFYGAGDDHPIGRSFTRPLLRVAVPDAVQLDWEKFQKESLGQGRYQYLKPIAQTEIFNLGVPRPNSDLSFLLTNLNFLRIGTILKKEVKPEFRYAFLYGAKCYEKVWRENYIARRDHKPEIKNTFIDLVESYAVKYEQKNLLHQNYRFNQLMTDLHYDLDLIKNQWRRSDQPEKYAGQTQEQVIETILKESPGYFNLVIHPSIASVAALAEKFFPWTMPGTWPTAIMHEGVYKFDTGAEDVFVALKKQVEENLFVEEERKGLRALENKNEIEYCKLLQSKFPPQLK